MTPVESTSSWDRYNRYYDYGQSNSTASYREDGPIDEIEEDSDERALFGFSAIPNIDELPIFYGRVPKNYSGVAKFKSDSGRSYEGIFEMGEFIQGSLTFTDGIIFQGKFERGHPYGDCTVTFPCGVSYKAQIKNDKFYGPIVFNNGAIHVGAMDNFKLEGVGKLTFKGSIYEGEFHDNQFHGLGRFILAGGVSCSGRFENDEFISGTITFPDGRVYKGQVKHGKFHGRGKFTCPNGPISIADGQFQDGEFLEGTIAFPSGITFQGKFKHGRAYGECTVTLANGVSYKGRYFNNSLLDRITYK